MTSSSAKHATALIVTAALLALVPGPAAARTAEPAPVQLTAALGAEPAPAHAKAVAPAHSLAPDLRPAGLVSPPVAQAQTADLQPILLASGAPDTTFGTNGGAFTNIDTNGTDAANAVAVQADGKIVVGGSSEGGFALARYNTNGSLDAGFGTNGTVVRHFGPVPVASGGDGVNAIALQSDGKIVVAASQRYRSNSAVLRYNADGSLDTSFHTNGVAIVHNRGEARSVAVQSDGKIVVAASQRYGNNSAVLRYTAGGFLDPTFGTGGIVTTDLVGGASAVAVQSDGKIVVAGSNSNDFAVVRYNADGSLDTGFDTDGTVTTDIDNSSRDSGHSIALQSDGKIVMAGLSDSIITTVRYNADGSLDTAFDTDGIVTSTAYGGFDSRVAAVVQSDGKIVVAGTGSSDFAVLRYNADGSLDTAFDTDGTVTTDISTSSDDGASAAALQSDGKIVVAGSSDRDFAVVRYDTGGSLDTGFDTDGKTTTNISTNGLDVGWSAARQSDGKIVVAGWSHTDLAVVRYNSNGSLDTAFDTDGIVTTDLEGFRPRLGDIPVAVALQANGKIVVATDHGGDLTVVRYDTGGSLDASFDTDGIVTTDIDNGSSDSGHSIALQSDGKIVVGASAGPDFAVVRYNSDGSLDMGFDTDGIAVTAIGDSPDPDDGAAAAALQSDGKIVVAGTYVDDFAVVRFNSDGTLDTSFDTNGIAVTDLLGSSFDGAGAVAVQGNGKIVVAGATSRIQYGDDDLAVVRYNSNGTLDTSFDRDGVATTNIGHNDSAAAAAMQSDGKILVLSGRYILRYNSNGSLDTAFDNDGIAFIAFSQTAVGGVRDGTHSMVVQPDGKILAAGADGNDFALWRYDPARSPATPPVGFRPVSTDEVLPRIRSAIDESLDPGFGSNGKTTVNIGLDSVDTAYAVARQTDGKVIVAGVSNRNFAMARYNTDGSLDTSFGTNGTTVLHRRGAFNQFRESVGLAVQSDGRILVAGDQHGGVLLMRYNSDGSIDSTFGTDGITETDISHSFSGSYHGAEVNAIALQSDGKIVVAGQVQENINTDIVVLRFHSSGSLDTGFGTGGAAITNLRDGRGDSAHAVAVQSDAKIVVAGTTNNDIAVLRYNSSGSLDTGFGTGGAAITNLGGTDSANGLALQSDGKIVVTGAGNGDIAVLRYSTDGSLDTGFDTDGIATTDLGSFGESGRAVMVHSDGKIIVAGTDDHAGSADADVVVARYNADGSLDTGFDTDGIATTDLGESDRASGLALQPDGKAVVAATAVSDFALLRYNADGSLDTGFDTDGIATTNIDDDGPDNVRDMALQGDGKILVLSGSSILRYNSDGSLDTDFGTGGAATATSTSAVGAALVLQSDGKIVVAGPRDHDSVVLARLNADGSLDTGFGTGGTAVTDLDPHRVAVGDVVLQSDGKIVVAGTRNGDFMVVRYNAHGSLDTGFGTDGTVTTQLSDGQHSSDSAVGAAAIQSDGKIVVAGKSDRSPVISGFDAARRPIRVDSGFAVARYNAGGSLDTTFGAGGVATAAANEQSLYSSGPNGITIQPDGKIIVVGDGGHPYNAFTVMRFNVDGSLDTDFHTDGVRSPYFSGLNEAYGVAVQSDGKIVVAGEGGLQFGSGPSAGLSLVFAVLRFNVDGSLDTTFATDGIALAFLLAVGNQSVVARFPVVLQSDGKIVVAGSHDGDIALARFDPGSSAQVPLVTEVTVPGPPTGVVASAQDRSAAVSWTAPSFTGNALISGYTATASPGGRSCTTTGAVSCTVTGLNNGTAYTFTVVARNEKGVSAASEPSEPVTPTAGLGVPTGVTATPGDGSLVAGWTEPGSDGGSPITGYTATASPGVHTCSAGASDMSCTITGLENGTPYTVTVTVTNQESSSAVSAASAPATPRTVPDPPTGVTAQPAEASLAVSWTAPAFDGGATVTEYTATAAPGGNTCTTTGETTCTITGLTDGDAYTVTVIAANEAGASAASQPSQAATPRTVPDPPTAVMGAAADASVTVSWAPPVLDGGAAVAGYTAISSPGRRTCTTTGAVSCTVTGLDNGTAYTFTVTAANEAGDSRASQRSAPVTPRTVPDPPRSVSAVPGDSSAEVSWRAPSFNGGAAVTGYTATATPDGSTCTTTGATSCAVTGLDNGTAYTFTVTAANEAGGSEPSQPSTAVTARTVPDAPTAVTATASEDGQSQVSWTAPSFDGGAEIARYTATADPDGRACTATGPDATACTVTGLANGATYTFTVVAHNVAGPSTASAASSQVVPAGAPDPPSEVTAEPAGDGIDVSWSEPASTGGPPISTYTATAEPGAEPDGHTCTPVGSATSCTITGLVRGRSYEVTVTAHNAGSRISAPSAPVTATMPAGPPDAPGGVMVDTGNGDARVSWQAPAGTGALDATVVEYEATAIPSVQNPDMDARSCTAVGAAATACTITGLANGTAYDVTVTAENSYGLVSTASTPPVTVTPSAPSGAPDAPTGVTVRLDGGGATVSWTPPAVPVTSLSLLVQAIDPITGYEVHASPGPGRCSAAADETSCPIEGLAPGHSYTFAVTALSAAGRSAASEASRPAAVAAAAPGEPAAVTAVPGGGWVRVIWEAPATDGGAAITRYTAVSTPSGRSCTATGAGRSCTVTGLTNGIEHTFTVTARNARGTSSPSQPSAAVWVTVPTGVRAEPGTPGAGEVVVTWTAPDTGAGGITIAEFEVVSMPGQRTCTTGSVDTTCTVRGLVNDRAYTFTVTAKRSDGLLATSAASNRTTPKASAPRPRPPGGGGGLGPVPEPEPEDEEEPEAVVFSDVAADAWYAPHVAHIASLGVTTGYPDGTYRPDRAVTRAQMASFLARALDLAVPDEPAGFTDVDPRGVHASNIEALFAAGITVGCRTEPPRYCPQNPVTRAQMASFLARALDLAVPDEPAGFTDVDPQGVHASNIEALFAAGITVGCRTEPLRYCPQNPVTRAQMAAFLSRAINRLQDRPS